MSILNKIARGDGFYADNIYKLVDRENRCFFATIFFVKNFIFFRLEPIDKPVLMNESFISVIKAQHYKISREIQTKQITQDEFPKELSTYTETSESLKAKFVDGTDDMKLTLFPRIFNGVLLNIELEGFQMDWINPTSSGIKNRKVIEGTKIKFFHY